MMLINTEEAAKRLGVNPETLAILRSRGGGVPYVKQGRAVMYETEDLDEYPVIKFAAQKNGNAYGRTYLIKVTKAGALHSILKRKAASLPHALAELSLYPSLKGCEFEDVTTPEVKPGAKERIINELTAAKGEIKEAFFTMLTGETSAKKQAAQRKYERIIDRSINKALKAK